jgi:nucleotide-binding universal stress UspA family protein
MKPLKQILVPVDFSEPSRAALDYAAQLARPFTATLDVLTVWEAPIFLPYGSAIDSGVSDATLLEEVERRARQGLRELLADAAKRGIEVRASHTQMGSPAHVICEFAKTGGYDLIVIGTHGRSGISRALIGSVAERVVRLAHCPVLSVRQVAKPG